MSITIISRGSRFAVCTSHFSTRLPLNLFYLWSQVRWTDEGIWWNNINKLSTRLQLIGQCSNPSYFTALLLGSHDILLSGCFPSSVVVSRPVRYWKLPDVSRFKSTIAAWSLDWRGSPASMPANTCLIESRDSFALFKSSYNVSAGLYRLKVQEHRIWTVLGEEEELGRCMWQREINQL